MDDVAQRYATLRAEIPASVTLVAVSKFHPVEAIRAAYEAGGRVFGESRVQELLRKVPELPSDIAWHFIGHLQRNKVASVVGVCSLIHGCDSLPLLETIAHEAEKKGMVQDVLLQVHVAMEETKFGFSIEELREVLPEILKLGHIRVRGLMAMASNTSDEVQVANEFKRVKALFDELKQHELAGQAMFDTLSMGMSSDYPIAMACGSNMLRIGTSIFGERVY